MNIRRWAASAAALVAILGSVGASPQQAISLYDQAAYVPLIAEQKAFQVGDVLTVVVQETATASAAVDAAAQRDMGFTAQVGSNKTGPHSATLQAGTDGDGGGKTQRTGRLAATLSVRVVDRTSSGDLVIQGEQVLTLNGERQLIRLSGVVRPRDVGDNNVVLSSRVADARIDFDGEGFIADKSKPGWVSRLLTLIGF